MIGSLLRDALAGVPAGDRVGILDEAVREWGDQLARLAGATQRDPYLRRVPEILDTGLGLARTAADAPGYADVALALCGLLAGLMGRPAPGPEVAGG